jgi:hypothetical protein
MIPSRFMLCLAKRPAVFDIINLRAQNRRNVTLDLKKLMVSTSITGCKVGIPSIPKTKPCHTNPNLSLLLVHHPKPQCNRINNCLHGSKSKIAVPVISESLPVILAGRCLVMSCSCFSSCFVILEGKTEGKTIDIDLHEGRLPYAASFK